jgi:AcrB/AcrD/AcrF family
LFIKIVHGPALAIVISVITVFLGALAVKTLPILQLPSIAPPIVAVADSYPGSPGDFTGRHNRQHAPRNRQRIPSARKTHLRSGLSAIRGSDLNGAELLEATCDLSQVALFIEGATPVIVVGGW